jgi:CheY-like chemotaxis protein
MPSPTYLLIDDDADDLEIFGLALQDTRLEYHFVTAGNALEALDLFRDAHFLPAYIFLDLNMPMKTGKEFLTEIKSSEKLRHIPVIIYTTSSHPNDVGETERLGAAHYLVKPSSIDSLTRILVKLFNKQPLPYFLTEEIKDLVM